ncbi:FtsK/SpoIIIE domain-containing protein [Neobacillus vireti]|uniref:FtsK/SpoIIIE domain-containing protein n=1 Tax=Neobacillus vireti TaxID=220686 RepID=UPI002FFECA0C
MISRLINKTPLTNEKYNVYEIDNIDTNLVNQITQSRFAGEGIFCIEQLSMPDYKEGYLITPSFCKEGLPVTDKEWNFKGEDVGELTIYELLLDKPSFMPLDSKQFIKLLDCLTAIPSATVFSQALICKRLDDWRENAIHQYKSFLNGNDYPMDSKIGIKFQGKVLNVLNKIGNFSVKRDPIDEMEQKILSHNYRFECRFIVYEQKYVNNFVENMEKNLKKLTFFNEFSLKKAQNKRKMINFIEKREFQPELVNQMLSESEIYSLLCSNKSSTVQKVELEKPVKQQSVVRTLEESMLLQNATKLMPYSENKNVEIDQSKAEQINQAFKRVGIVKKSLKVTEMYQGCSLLKVQMQIPTDITYTTISKKLVDIQAALGNQNVSIEIGDKPDTINVFLPLENRDVLYFRNVLESVEFQEYKKLNTLPIIIGENVNGGYMFADLTKLRHMLVAGATGGGKSIFVNLIILSLLLNVPPDMLTMYLIDPKMVEFTQFNGFPQVRSVITDMKKANGILSSLCDEMDRRYEVFSKAGVRDIQGYNELDDKKMNYIVCVIDELADLMMVNSTVEDNIVRLGQKARAAGVHLIIATQRPSVDVVTGLIKANMPCRIAFSTTSAVDSKTILDKGGAEKLLGRGDGIAKIEGNKKEFERFQSPVLTLDSKQETKIYADLKELFSEVEVAVEELPEAESEMDKLKRIIASTNDLRISELQSKMGIAIGKVHSMLKELLDEGWLRKEGRSYVVNVDQNELDKWRESGA